MTDRRRVTRLVVLVVAGLAVAGTSAPTPPPGPTQPLNSGGTLHMTADQPVAVQPLVFVVEHGQLASIAITPTISGAPDQGSILTSIVRTDQVGSGSDPAISSPSGPPTRTWSAGCQSNPCVVRYALVVTWFDAPPRGEVDVTWAVDATATYAGSAPAGATPGRVTLAAPAAEPGARATLSHETSGKPVHLTEGDRFRSWTITLTRDSSAEPATSSAPTTLARLDLTAAQVAGPAVVLGEDGQPEDRRARNRPDPPVQLRLDTSDRRQTTSWAPDRPIEFDPFVSCRVDLPCETTLTIQVVWADGRPDTAFDAGWTLDLASIHASEPPPAIEATVEAVPPIHLASASAGGTFDEPGSFNQPAVHFVVNAPPFRDQPSDAGRTVPARALATVMVTSVGAVPLPADAEISIFAGAYGVIVHPGESATFAFEPRGLCRADVLGTCSAEGALGAAIVKPNRNQTKIDGMVARIEWTIEAAVGTVDKGTAVFLVEPQPTRRP